jgi:hypothetical protein
LNCFARFYGILKIYIPVAVPAVKALLSFRPNALSHVQSKSSFGSSFAISDLQERKTNIYLSSCFYQNNVI